MSVERKGFPLLQQYVFHLREKVWQNDFLIGFAPLENINDTLGFVTGSVADYYLALQTGIDGTFVATTRQGADLAKYVGKILADRPHVLLAHNPKEKPKNLEETQGILARSLVECNAIVNTPELLVQRHVHPTMGCGHWPAPVEFDNGIKLIDRAARYDHLAEVIQVLTWWEVPDRDILNDYNVSLQVISPDWRNVRQVDRHLSARFLSWNVIELSTSGLPALDYRLVLILYDRENGKKVRGTDIDSGNSDKFLTVLQFTIN